LIAVAHIGPTWKMRAMHAKHAAARAPMALFLVTFALAACSLTTSWDGLRLDVGPDAAADAAVLFDAGLPDDAQASQGKDDAQPEDDAQPKGGPQPPACVAGRYYCGGNGIVGEASTLYQCQPDGGVVPALPCGHGCARRSSKGDACICVVGSPYCGNDQIVGDKDSLYRCESDYTGTLVAHCDAGCFVNTGANDACH
jgi:hypothetical protein